MTVRGRGRGAIPGGMRRLAPGMYEGPDMRAERAERGWRTWIRMRDVAAMLGDDPGSGLYEYHPEAGFVPIGTYPSLAMAGMALDRLRAGTHLVRWGHSDAIGSVPTRLVTNAEGYAYLAEFGIAGDHAESEGPAPR